MERKNFFSPLLNPTFLINLKRGRTTFNEFDGDAKAHRYSPDTLASLKDNLASLKERKIQLCWGATSKFSC